MVCEFYLNKAGGGGSFVFPKFLKLAHKFKHILLPTNIALFCKFLLLSSLVP